MSKGKVKVERRRVNPYFILVNDGAFAEGGNIMDYIKANPNVIGGAAGMAGELGAGLVDNLTGGEDNRTNVVGNAAASGALSGAGKGAQLGSALGPLGMGIGAGIGALAGGLSAGINAKHTSEAFARDKQILYRALGGPINVDSIEGPVHEDGGIQITENANVEGGEAKVGNEILSDRLINPETGRTFAEDAKRIEKKYIRDNDSYSNKAKTAEIAKLIELNKVERERQQALDQEIASDYHAYGGAIKKGANGKWDIDISMRKAITEAAKARGLGVNDYASKLFALGGTMGGPGTPGSTSTSTSTPSPTYSASDIKKFMAIDSGVAGGSSVIADLTGATLLTDPAALNAYYAEYGNTNAGKRIWSTPSGGYVVGGVDPNFVPPAKKTTPVTPSTPSTPDNTKAYFIMNGDNDTPQWVDAGTYNSHTGHKTTMPLDASGYPVMPGSGGQRYTNYVASPTGIPAYDPSHKLALGGPLDEFDIPSGEVKLPTAGVTANLPKMTTNDQMFNEFGEFIGDPTENKFPEGFAYDPIESDLGFDPTAEFLNETEKKGSKIGSQELGLLASNLPAMDNFLKSRNPETTQYDRFNPETLDLSEVRGRNQRDTDMARKIHGANVRGNATSSGEALLALSTGNSALTSGQMEADLTSLLQEKSANNSILNQAGQINTQIANQENDANAQNRAMAKGLGNLALSDISMNTQGYMRDKTLTEADLQKNETLLQAINAIAPNYKWSDDNGELAIVFNNYMSKQKPQ